jgi:uncharacterized cupredoxin-like copper-binding protein
MRRFVAAAIAAVTVGGLVGAMGVGTAAAQTDNQEFCDAVLNVQAVVNAEDFDQLEPALAGLEAAPPPEVAASVTTVTGAYRTALQEQTDPSEDPAVAEALATIGQYVFDNCGWQTAEVSMAEYVFDGLPKSFTTGPAAIKITNDGAEIHELMTVRIKSKDKLKAIVKLSEKKANKKVQFVDHTVVQPGETGYTFIDFSTPGRYGAVCFVPVGTLPSDAEGGGEDEHGGGGDGKPHALEGMYKEFKVTKAAS